MPNHHMHVGVVFSHTGHHIGLVATASTSFCHPYHVARLHASLDHLSAGRADWKVATSGTDAEAYNFGLDEHDERAQEFAQIVKGLWESGDDDAVPRDNLGLRRYHQTAVAADQPPPPSS